MNLLTIETMTKSYTDRNLFEDVTFGIGEGDKIGIIGINGTGKSTLLKIVAGLETPGTGIVTKGKNVKIAYLSQIPVFDESINIIENILKDIKDHEDIWTLEAEAKSMLQQFDIEEYTGFVSNLSGGEKKRVALVKALLQPAEILVLDEPTNHLDHEMAEWLEEYLKKYRGAIIMVTHDRYFLDTVTNKIIELDSGKLYSYPANYTEFLRLKSEREEIALATERKSKSLYKVELEWMLRGARARSTKQKAHIQRFEQLRDREKIKETQNVAMTSMSSRLGNKTVEVEHVCKAYGDKCLMKDFTYIFLKQDRIGIIGKNGCGKSTLLKMIYGLIEPDGGTIDKGTTVKVGYFSQENEMMDESIKVIDYIKEAGEYVKTTDGTITASQMLEKFLFTGAMQYSLIAKLSGGEKRRLYLLRVLMEAPNVLLLDEPTNDLDIQTLTILEQYLDSFDGIVITVSHDRYFLDRTVNRIFSFEKAGIVKQYEGTYTECEEKRMLDKAQETPVASQGQRKETAPRTRQEKLKFTFNEQREFKTIDEEIEKLENDIESIDTKIEANASDFVKLNELMEKKRELEETLEYKTERWVYLNDLAERIEQEKK